MDKQHEGRQLNLDPPHWFLQRGVPYHRTEGYRCMFEGFIVACLKPSVPYIVAVSWTVFENKSYSGDTDRARVALTPGPTSLQAALM